MLSPESIKELRKAETVASLNALGVVEASSEPVAVVPDDFDITSLEQFMPNRSRFKGIMETNDVDSFASYNKSISGKNPTCFINGASMTAKTIFDIGTEDVAGHCSNEAKLSLVRTPEYQALMGINGDRFSQKEFTEWVEDYSDNITFVDSSGGQIDTGLALQALRSLTIKESTESTHVNSDFADNRSLMERVEADGGSNMPYGFSFECVPYDNIESRSFMVRINVITSHDSPRYSVRIAKLESHEDEIVKEFMALVALILEGTGISVYIGSFNVG